MSRLTGAGIGAVINCRAGVTMTSLKIPSQEEVNLLNIVDFTGKQTSHVFCMFTLVEHVGLVRLIN